MNITKKIALTLATLALASFPVVVESCNGHADHHHHAHDDHHLQNADEDCSEDNVPDGTSVGRRVLEAAVRTCNTAEPSDEMRREMPRILTRYQWRVGMNRRLQDQVIDIPVYFHIIKRSDETGGEVTPQQITDQIAKMNEAFSGNFAFTLVDTDTSFNSTWYTSNAGTQSALEMKTALKKGGVDSLNLYTSSPPDNTLGWVSYWMTCRFVACCELAFKISVSGYAMSHHFLGLALIFIQSFSLSLFFCPKGYIAV
jgi:hypothetical protein